MGSMDALTLKKMKMEANPTQASLQTLKSPKMNPGPRPCISVPMVDEIKDQITPEEYNVIAFYLKNATREPLIKE